LRIKTKRDLKMAKSPLAIFALVILVLVQGSTRAEEDLLDIYRLAIAEDPQFKQVGSAKRTLEESRKQARSQLLLPTLNFEANVSKNYQDITIPSSQFGQQGSQDFTSRLYQLNLTQPLFHYDRYVALKQAGKRVRQSALEVDAAHQDLMIRVAENYIAVLAAEDNLVFSRAETAALKRQLEQSNERFEVGLIAITDVQEAQAGYDLARADEIQARNGLDNALEALREITSAYHSDLAGLRDQMPLVRPDPPEIDSWARRARSQNLRLSAAKIAMELAKAEIRRESSGHLPTLDLVGTYGEDDRGGRFGQTSIDATTIGVQVSVPLFEGGQVNSRTREAVYRYQEAAERLEQQRRAVERQSRDAFLGVLTGISRVQALKQALSSSETATKATQAGYSVGTRTAVDVVNSERDLLRARRDYSQTRYDYMLNGLRLKHAAGTLSPEELAVVNDWFTGDAEGRGPQIINLEEEDE
ncbi:MAG: TolC family outer membrane protein, partial [Gammaproteobacteria bacterium]